VGVKKDWSRIHVVAAAMSCRCRRRYSSFDGVLAAGRFPAQADELRLYLSIATIDASAPLPPLVYQMPTWGQASAPARAWELNQLAERLADLAGENMTTI
jgi:hypothetical protein